MQSLGLLAVPPAVAGVIGLVSILASSGLALLYLREGTAMEKRVFIPTVTNLSSVMWNTQFRLFIGMSVCAFFFNTLPTLLPFFLQFSMGLSEGQADVYYLVFIAVFVISGLVALLVIRKPLELLGTLKFGKMCLLAVSLLGYVALGLSYLSPIAIVVAFSCLGFFLTAANVVFSTISAECVDYDELLCGKKRASSYQAVLKPIATFIRVAGPSIPLALMSATGFKEAVGLFF